MALVHQQTRKGVTYQVRSAGRTRRLYTNGAFHTQYHPGRTFSNGIWDLLTIPALYSMMRTGTPEIARADTSALVLGVGGGTAIHHCHTLLGVNRIIGVELDAIHLRLARRYFGLNRVPGLTLVQADAIRWIRQHRQRHQLVIDDLYLHAPETTGATRAVADPVRPALPDPRDWLKTLSRRVSGGGVLVQNALDARRARQIAHAGQPWLEKEFPSALLFTMPQYTNGILALYRNPVRARELSPLVRRYLTRFGKVPGFRCQQLF